jgi:hypothetical protein
VVVNGKISKKLALFKVTSKTIQHTVTMLHQEQKTSGITSLTAHILAIEPMLFVMVTSVALARSAFVAFLRRSGHIM